MTATAAPVTRDDAPAPDEADVRSGGGRVRAVVLVLSLLAIVGATVRVAIHDPTELHVSGDQSAFVYQAISIAGGNLSYDAADQARWVELEWGEQPRGLFVQRRDAEWEGWAFAKPYGYSVLLAPAIALMDSYGITFVGALLFLAYAAIWYFVGRTRWRPTGAAAVAAAAAVASNAWPMAFPAHADLFVAVLVGGVVLGSVRLAIGGRVGAADGAAAPVLAPAWRVLWAIVAAASAGMLVTEKLPALVAIGPLFALALWRSPWRPRIAAVAAGAVVVAVSVVPYLYYSDGASWNAYGGDRYYAPGSTPWSGGTIENLVPWRTAESMSPGKVLDALRDPSDDLASAALTYAVGRHTGALTHQPVVATLTVAAAFALVRRRRSRHAGEGDGNEVESDEAQFGDEAELSAEASRVFRRPGAAEQLPLLAAAVMGLGGYVVLYLLTFTDNYFGGGQSVGNRYFLQVSAVVAVIPVAAWVRERTAIWAAAIGAAAGVVLITPQLFQPEEAFYHLERTSPVQRLLPFDGSQSGNWRFECDPDVDCVPPPVAPYPG